MKKLLKNADDQAAEFLKIRCLESVNVQRKKRMSVLRMLCKKIKKGMKNNANVNNYIQMARQEETRTDRGATAQFCSLWTARAICMNGNFLPGLYPHDQLTGWS